MRLRFHHLLGCLTKNQAGGENEKNPGIVKLRASAHAAPLHRRGVVKRKFLDELTCEFACASESRLVKRRFLVGVRSEAQLRMRGFVPLSNESLTPSTNLAQDGGHELAQDAGYARFFLPMRRTLNISVVQAQFDGASLLFHVHAPLHIRVMHSTPPLT